MVIRYTKAPFGLDGARHVSWIAVGETTVALKSLGADGTVKGQQHWWNDCCIMEIVWFVVAFKGL